MAEKRGYVEIGETGPRKTRVAWSKLDRLNPNPDRGLSYSVARPIEHDVIECRPFPFWGTANPLDEIPEDDSGRKDEWTA